MKQRFEALEYDRDGGLARCTLSFHGSPERGFAVQRNGAPHLQLGPGYVPLRTTTCGVCSTDLARRFLPFRLPQVIGHEVVATDADGRRCVVEINASHAARRVAADCPACDDDLPTHCPDRLVLGIHDLPGGFGPWLLAPVGAVLAVPDAVPTETAALTEPFAAALRAADVVAPRGGDVVAVLGPRRLGLLVIAALRARATEQERAIEIVAIGRHRRLLALAEQLGADRAVCMQGDGAALPDAMADVVVDTTGQPSGLQLALRLARREAHLKSTHGRPALGLSQLTAMVVDELSLERDDGGKAAGDPDPHDLLDLRGAPPPQPLAFSPFRTVRVGNATEVDAAIRPVAGIERGLARPRGRLLLSGDDHESPLLSAVARRGLRLTTSRCGDFRAALALFENQRDLRALGAALVTDRYPADALDRAFRRAAAPDAVKVLVDAPA